MNKTIKFTDVMLDIETTGRTPGCAIICIAAVLFNVNTGEISSTRRFSMDINLSKQTSFGYTTCPKTVNWWKGTNKNLFFKLCNSDNHFVEVARKFQEWYRSLPYHNQLRLWGNSPKFDISILEGWYRKSLGGKEFQQFWNTWNERDVRTIASLDPNIKKNMIFKGNKHNPIDDCIHQIKYTHQILKKHNLKIQ